MRIFSFFCGLLTLVLAGTAVTTHAFEIPPNDGFVTDSAGILTPADDEAIEGMLTEYRAATSNEIAVVVVSNLAGEAIEEVALQIGRTWGVGSTKDNGILMLVSYEDRTVRIEVGYGLEGAVPDLVAKGIIDTDLVPAFREGKYADGIQLAILSLQKHIGGEYTADRYKSESDMSGLQSFFIFFILMFVEWIVAILGRTKSWWLGGVFGGVVGIVLTILHSFWLAIPILVFAGLLLDYLISKTYKTHRRSSPWWAGGGWGPGGGGGGRGGFGGFGGGGFGGGGASGRW